MFTFHWQCLHVISWFTNHCQYLHALLVLHHTTSVCLPLLGLHTTGRVYMPMIGLHSTASFGMPLPGLHTTASVYILLPGFSLSVIHCLGYQVTSGRSFHLSSNGGHRKIQETFLVLSSQNNPNFRIVFPHNYVTRSGNTMAKHSHHQITIKSFIYFYFYF